MENGCNEVLEFMATRRSHPLVALREPGPDRPQTEALLHLASRVPDHGRLEPWRFIIPGPDMMANLAALARDLGEARGIEAGKLEKSLRQFTVSPRLVIVVCTPVQSEKIPQTEQILTCGAVCLGLVNAALASGWGAVWLSGWHSHDAEFISRGLNLAPHEWVAGMIHIGTGSATPPERARPNLDEIVEWHP